MKAHNAASKVSRHHDAITSPTRPFPGVALSRKRESTSMASEYLILTEIASGLSTYVQNRTSDQFDSFAVQNQDFNHSNTNNKGKVDLLRKNNASSKAASLRRSQGTISDDAKLLLNFKEATPKANTKNHTAKENNRSFPAAISPSFSFEAKRYFEEFPHCSTATATSRTKAARVKNERDLLLKPRVNFQQCDSERTFSFIFPSLSLSDNIQHQHINTHVPITNIPLKNYNSPAQLFSRLIRKQSSLDVSEVAETIAHNVMLSFTTALEWRTKTWIRDLSRKITTSFHQEAAKISKHESFSNAKKNKKKSTKANGKKNIDSSSKKASSRLDDLKEKFKKSQEARVIKALSQTWSTVHVHDIKTTYFVLERQYDDVSADTDAATANTSNSHAEEKKTDTESYTPFLPSEVFRPLKKCRMVTDEFSKSDCHSTTQHKTLAKYTLSHVLNLDSRCSVSTSSEERISVSLQTPGVIHGTFVRNEDGEAFLIDLSIDLDTENLAVSMEQKSRFVVRTAAEECIVSPPCISQLRRKTSKGWSNCSVVSNNTSNLHGPNKHPRNVKSYAPVTPFATQPETVDDAALVTPNENGFISSDSEDMPPPPPRLPVGDGKRALIDMKRTLLNPRRVSPVGDLTSISNRSGDQMVSPLPGNGTFFGMSKNENCSPAWVSPNESRKLERKKQAKDVIDGNNGPLLPALVEVACAAHTESLV